MYWFNWRCHANDAGGTLQSHNNSEEGNKKLAKTEPKQMCLQLLPKGGEEWNSSDGRWYRLFHTRDAATGKARSPRVNRWQASWW